MNITINVARLSYPNLFKPKAFEEGQTPKYSAVFLLDKKTHAKDIADFQAKMNAVAEEKWGKGKVPKGVKPCLRDGKEKEDTDGYGPGIMFFSAASDKRVQVVDRKLDILTEEDGKPYAGCYVNVVVRLWAQDNKFGKRINAQLRTIQFVKDGEAFGDKPAAAADHFKALPDEDGSGLE